MPDRERIIELLDSYGVGGSYAYDLCDEIDECYAPELEKARLFILNKDYIDRFYSEAEELRTNAEKWRTLVRISKCNQIACIEGTCQYKKLCNPQMPLCGEARDLMLAIFDVNKVVAALEGEGEKR